MRILHIEDRFHPDLGYQLNFMAKLHSKDHEMIILTSDSCSLWGIDDISKLQGSENKFTEKHNVKIIRLPAYLAKGGKNNILIKGLINKICEINPDIIYVHCVESYSAARVLMSLRLRKYPIIADTHNLYNQFRNSLKFRIYMFVFRNLIIKTINDRKIKVFYTAEENRQMLINDYGIDANLVRSGLIGTDSGHYYFDKEEGNKLRTQLKIAEGNAILLYAGKINFIKQPHLILNAIKMVENDVDAPLTLLFVGSIETDYFEGNCKVNFENKLINVHWLPQVPNSELFKYYSMADFAVFPRHNTLSSLDAQACRLPIIMESDITNDERLKEGGLTFKSGDMIALGKRMLELINNRELRKKLGLKGQEYVIAKYDYKEIIRNMEIELEKVVIEKK